MKEMEFLAYASEIYPLYHNSMKFLSHDDLRNALTVPQHESPTIGNLNFPIGMHFPYRTMCAHRWTEEQSQNRKKLPVSSIHCDIWWGTTLRYLRSPRHDIMYDAYPDVYDLVSLKWCSRTISPAMSRLWCSQRYTRIWWRVHSSFVEQANREERSRLMIAVGDHGSLPGVRSSFWLNVAASKFRCSALKMMVTKHFVRKIFPSVLALLSL